MSYWLVGESRLAFKRDTAAGDEGAEVRIEAKLDDLAARLERLETVLGRTPKA